MTKRKTKLVIASTTSTQNSGLFDILIPRFEKSSRYNLSVEVIAVETGKALRIAKKGEADVILSMILSKRRSSLPRDTA